MADTNPVSSALPKGKKAQKPDTSTFAHIEADKITMPQKKIILDILAQKLNGKRIIRLQGDVSGETETDFAKNKEVVISTELGEEVVGLDNLAQEVIDEMAKAADLEAHVADKNNPHEVTTTQIGAVPIEIYNATVSRLEERIRAIEDSRLIVKFPNILDKEGKIIDNYHRLQFSRNRLQQN